MLNFWENNYSVDRGTFISAMLLGAKKPPVHCSQSVVKHYWRIKHGLKFRSHCFYYKGVDASLGGGLIAWELIQI